MTFHPARLLEEIHVSFEPLTSAKGLELHCNIASELEGTYISDPLRLRQIINNLLSNAVKFTDKGGVTMTACYENRRLVVAVADTGKGMEPADRERIFRSLPACPVHRARRGSALGSPLYVCLCSCLRGQSMWTACRAKEVRSHCACLCSPYGCRNAPVRKCRKKRRNRFPPLLRLRFGYCLSMMTVSNLHLPRHAST